MSPRNNNNVHKYGQVALRVLSTSCTLNRVHTMPIQAFEVTANESNGPNKAKLEFKLIIYHLIIRQIWRLRFHVKDPTMSCLWVKLANRGDKSMVSS